MHETETAVAEQKTAEDTGSSVGMRIEKRNGSFEPVDLNKIVRAIQLHSNDLTKVDPMIVATRTISGIYDGATTAELDQLAIQTAASYIATEPEYSQLAARMFNTFIGKEVRNRDIQSFSQSIRYGHEQGLVNDHVFDFVRANRRKLNDAIDKERGKLFQYFGLRTVYDRYLLKDPHTRMVTEIPQYFFMRVACGLAETPNEAIEFYNLISSLEYMPSSPTLFNSATCRTQLSVLQAHHAETNWSPA